MRALDKVGLRFRSLFRRGSVERELAAEMRFHLDQQIEENVAAGMTPEEARSAAMRTIGGMTQFQEECRDMRQVNVIENLARDLRFGLRSLRMSPGFTVVAALTLALGIGANTAIFSVVYAALLRPLPYHEPSRLIMLGEVRRQQAGGGVVSNPDYLDWKRASKTFQSLAGFSGDGFIMRGAGEPQAVDGAQVTINFFSTLGVKPFLGRDFAAGEDVATGPNVCILSYAFWSGHFRKDPQVIGRPIQLDANSVRIVGVLPQEFEFAPQGKAAIWVPMHLQRGMANRRSLRWMRVMGRLAPGASFEKARSEMELINANLAAAYPDANGSTQVVMIPLRDRIVGKIQPLLLVLFGAVGFVLLIACANVANLLMLRAAGRRREFAIRAALGANRRRLVSQVLTESFLLAACGTVLGFFLGQWGTSLLIAAIPQAQLDSMPFLRDAHANPAVFGFLCAAGILTALAFGLAPALQISQERSVDTLKEETRGSAAGSRRRLRNALVVVEIAVSLVLLIGAGLMLESLAALLKRNPGFDSQNLLTFAVNLPGTSYPNEAAGIRFDQEFAGRIRSLPGVADIASNSVIPLTGGGNSIRFLMEGRPMPAGHEYECNIRDISDNYFSIMKIPLVAGRFFNGSDDAAASPPHVIVNKAWVKQFSGGENPIGKRVKFTYSPTQPFREVVGIVGDTVDAGLDGAEEAALFLPFAQDTDAYINYMVRSAGNPAGLIGPVREALRQTDAELVMIQPTTMDQIIDQSPSVFLRRYPSYLIGSFAALALILAMVGLYGLVSYSVSQRTRELSIRMALGAQRNDVMRLVLGEGTRLALIGVAIGVVAALGLTRLMQSLLFGVNAADATTFTAVALVLGLIATAACTLPAWRAARADPMAALRYE